MTESEGGKSDESESVHGAVEGGPDNNFDLYCEARGKTNMNHCLGLVLGSDGL